MLEERCDAVTGAVPHDAVQPTPRQQEEEQHDRAVKIGVRAVNNRFEQAQGARQDHADRYRDIHVGAAMPQGIPRRLEEGSSRKGNGRQSDASRKPMKQVTRCAFRT